MFYYNEDLSIYATRGDAGSFTIPAAILKRDLQPGEIVRFKVFGKKDCENVVLQKDTVVLESADQIEIYLSGIDTKLGKVINKPTDYWYEVELNPNTDPKTIIGYDEDGAKVFKLFPEGDDVENPEIPPEKQDVYEDLLESVANCANAIGSHKESKNNPHKVTPDQIGAAHAGYIVADKYVADTDAKTDEVLNSVYSAMGDTQVKTIAIQITANGIALNGGLWFLTISRQSANNGSVKGIRYGNPPMERIRGIASGVWGEWRDPATAEYVDAAPSKEHNVKNYSSLSQIGLTFGTETIAAIAEALPNNSTLMYTVSSENAKIYPSNYGKCYVQKTEGRVEFQYALSKDPMKYFGVYYEQTAEWSGWNCLYHTGNIPTCEVIGARPSNWMPTAAEVGARPNSWMPTAYDVGARENTWLPTIAEIGAAPAGYGLGATALDSAADLNAVVTTGWCAFNTSTANAPYTGYGVVETIARNSDTLVQRVHDLIHSYSGYYNYGVSVERVFRDGAWQPWEYINPPMKPDKEYRTTERWNGKAVYKRLIQFGALPDTNTKRLQVATAATDLVRIEGTSVHSDGTRTPFVTASFMTDVTFIGGELLSVTTNQNASSWNGYPIICYIKD